MMYAITTQSHDTGTIFHVVKANGLKKAKAAVRNEARLALSLNEAKYIVDIDDDGLQAWVFERTDEGVKAKKRIIAHRMLAA